MNGFVAFEYFEINAFTVYFIPTIVNVSPDF